jgi:hypothetical protein
MLVDVARNLARWFLGTALRFERAYIAVELAGAIQKRLALVHRAARPEPLSARFCPHNAHTATAAGEPADEQGGFAISPLTDDHECGVGTGFVIRSALGSVDTYRIHKMIAARVTTAR